jgi:dipeptidyl aminopeptidase/acylaminoacyl peptidase
LGWLKDAQIIYFQSEESGYSHLYTLDLQTKTKMAITSGNFEVHQVQLAKDSNSFYLSTNLYHPGTRSFHHLDLKTLQFKSVLSDQGAYEVQLSPNEKQMVYRFSTSTEPWELFITSFKNPSKALQITHSTSPQFEAAALYFQKPQVLSFQASDGVSVYARLYEPNAAVKNGAAVLFVHGAGYLQNAHY